MVASSFQNDEAYRFLARVSSASVTPWATTCASASSSTRSASAMFAPSGSVSCSQREAGIEAFLE